MPPVPFADTVYVLTTRADSASEVLAATVGASVVVPASAVTVSVVSAKIVT